MDSYELIPSGEGYRTEPPLLVMTKSTAEISEPGATPMTFERKLRGLLLMSGEQTMGSAGRRGRPKRPVEGRAWSADMHARVNQKRRFVIQHSGNSWALHLHIEHWIERGGKRRSSWRLDERVGNEAKQLRLARIIDESQEVGTITAVHGDRLSGTKPARNGFLKTHDGSLDADLSVTAHLPLPVTALAMRLALWFPPPRVGTWDEFIQPDSWWDA